MWHFALLLSQCNTLVLSVFLYIASQTEDSHGNISAHRSALRVRQKTAMVSLHPVTLHCESDRRQLWYHFTPSLYPASQTEHSYGITSPRRTKIPAAARVKREISSRLIGRQNRANEDHKNIGTVKPVLLTVIQWFLTTSLTDSNKQ